LVAKQKIKIRAKKKEGFTLVFSQEKNLAIWAFNSKGLAKDQKSSNCQ